MIHNKIQGSENKNVRPYIFSFTAIAPVSDEFYKESCYPRGLLITLMTEAASTSETSVKVYGATAQKTAISTSRRTEIFITVLTTRYLILF
jgi:hypothetical protein